MEVILVGLGNPGSEYKLTRHNFGFMVLDKFALGRWEKKKNYYYQRVENCFLVKPRLFMNNSGIAVSSFFASCRIKRKDISEKLLVILDDYQIPFGEGRLRQHGSAGGHNGLKSIINELKTEEFWRLRLGIGPLPPECKPADFVLENFSPAEQKVLPLILERVVNWLKLLRKYSLVYAASCWKNKIC